MPSAAAPDHKGSNHIGLARPAAHSQRRDNDAANLVCRVGYARSARHTSARLKAFVYREYSIDRRSCHYDHLIPLSLGRATTPLTYGGNRGTRTPGNAARKDELQVYLRSAVCGGRMPLEQAQHEVAADWIWAYQRYIGDAEAQRRIISADDDDGPEFEPRARLHRRCLGGTSART